MKKKIVFVCHNVTLAHPVRTILLANSLDPEQYDCVLYMGEAYKNILPTCIYPIKYIPMMSPDEFAARLYDIQNVLDTDTIERDFHEEERIIDVEKPDLIIGDFRVTLQVSARKFGIPYLSLASRAWAPQSRIPYILPYIPKVAWAPQWLSHVMLNYLPFFTFRGDIQPMNNMRRRQHMPPVRASFKELYSDADYLAYCDLPLIFSEPSNLSAREHYIGPVIWNMDVPMPELGAITLNGKYTVYINLGSSGNKDILGRLCQTLAQEDINLIVATGNAEYPPSLAALAGKPNVYIAPFLPSDKIAALSDLVICNGGVPTVMTALLNGAYCIGIYTNMDQAMNMRQIAKQGLGHQYRNDSDFSGILNLVKAHKKLDSTVLANLKAAYAECQPEQRFPAFVARILTAQDNQSVCPDFCQSRKNPSSPLSVKG